MKINSIFLIFIFFNIFCIQAMSKSCIKKGNVKSAIKKKVRFDLSHCDNIMQLPTEILYKIYEKYLDSLQTDSLNELAVFIGIKNFQLVNRKFNHIVKNPGKHLNEKYNKLRELYIRQLKNDEGKIQKLNGTDQYNDAKVYVNNKRRNSRVTWKDTALKHDLVYWFHKNILSEYNPQLLYFLLEACKTDAEKIVNLLLLATKLNVNAPVDEYEKTVLIYATEYKSIKVIKALIQHGADVNLIIGNGVNPLIALMKKSFSGVEMEKVLEIITLLMSSGAKIDLKDSRGDSAISLLKQKKHSKNFSDETYYKLKFALTGTTRKSFKFKSNCR
ncbi:ankyrin repeat domain-containing protein [Candidatus Dependentiae bacterium]|nr:ankyrin repeat domain-containing protein [Candidatus Dependentiae bacterium]